MVPLPTTAIQHVPYIPLVTCLSLEAILFSKVNNSNRIVCSVFHQVLNVYGGLGTTYTFFLKVTSTRRDEILSTRSKMVGTIDRKPTWLVRLVALFDDNLLSV